MNRKNFIKSAALLGGALALFPGKVFANFRRYEDKIHQNFSFESWTNKNVNVLWIGHATVLINFYGTIILTDPVFFERVGVYMFGSSFGPARMLPPAVNINEIPKPDIVLLSHAHMDHMDYPTLKHLTNKYPGEISAVTAYLTSDVIDDLEWKDLTVRDWREDASVRDIHINALEVKHFGWRFPWEKDRSKGFMEDGRSYNAYVLEKNGYRILFGGDTAITDKFREQVKEKINVALMPIGAYDPWIRVHCNPEQALKMAEDVNADVIIPIHTMTFKQSDEPFNEPISRLKTAIQSSDVTLGLEKVGDSWSLFV